VPLLHDFTLTAGDVPAKADPASPAAMSTATVRIC